MSCCLWFCCWTKQTNDSEEIIEVVSTKEERLQDSQTSGPLVEAGPVVNVVRPATPTTVTRPATPTEMIRPATPTVSRPATPITITRPASPTTVIRPVTPTMVIRPASPTMVVNTPVTPTMVIRPITPTTVIRPVTPTTVIRPITPTTVIRPVTPTMVIRPVTPTMVIRPITPTTVIRPVTPTTVIRPVTPTTVIQPVTSTRDIRPVTPTTDIRPVTPTTVDPAVPTSATRPVTPTLDNKAADHTDVVHNPSPTKEELSSRPGVRSDSPPEVLEPVPEKAPTPVRLAGRKTAKSDKRHKNAFSPVVVYHQLKGVTVQDRSTVTRRHQQAVGLPLDSAGVKVPGGQADTPKHPAPQLTKEQRQCLGLPNLAQTCYLNATLQGLFSLGSFWGELLRQQSLWRSTPAASLIRCFADIRVARYTHDREYKRGLLRALKERIAMEAHEFQDDGQKDAHEFLCVILAQLAALAPVLQKRATEGAYICPVGGQLTFQLLSTRTCRQCGLQSFGQEEFSNLSLDLLAGCSVEDSLHRYLQESELEYRCDCGGNISGKWWSFLTLPRVLVIQLKRFRISSKYELEKVNEPVQLNRELLIFSGAAGDAAQLPSQKQDLEGDPGQVSNQDQEEPGPTLPLTPVLEREEEGQGEKEAGQKGCQSMGTRYRLVSVVSHIGSSAASGHYICDGHYTDGVPEDQTDRWLFYNDHVVKETTGTAVCKSRQRTAYLLFYERQ